MRAVAAQHSRLADLALSFPALLFALAVPRRGIDPARAVASVIAGDRLAEIATAAAVPFWLRDLPPEAMAASIPPLPDGVLFRRQVANHLPTPKVAAIWLQAVSDMADLAGELPALWIAKEIARDVTGVKLNRLRGIALWAWFSGQPGTFARSLIDKPWTRDFRFASALDAADDWLTTVHLHANLGLQPIGDLWLRPGGVDGFEFQPLTCAAEIADEAVAMGNCLRTYGREVSQDRARLWSVRRNGTRIATLSLGFRYGSPLPVVTQLKGPRNAEASFEVWCAAAQWLHAQATRRIDRKRSSSPPLDRTVWNALWRPYWLARQRIPDWLPVSPARSALDALRSA